MLKNCFFPVNYKNPISQTCGEIICENFDVFIINCRICKIKIFEFEEFVQHFKNVHLNDTSEETKLYRANENEQEGKQNYERIIKFEITEIKHEKPDVIRSEKYESSGENDELWDIEDDTNSDEDYNPEDANTDGEDDQEADEEHGRSIIKKTRKPKELSCEICRKKYADSRRLQLHIKIVHLREKPFKCSMCEQAFAEERSLKNHIGRKHTGFECTECHKNFTTNRNLKRHMLIHLEKKEFICTEDNCGKAFATNGQLKDHQRYHSSEMFICEECGYKCRQRESLIVHKRHHTGEKPFGCKLCDRRFGSKPLLNEHMAAHETERKHVCDVCGKSFNRPKALYHHKHLHLGVKKFVCKICGQAYAQAAGLSAHTRKHREDAASFITASSSPTNNDMGFTDEKLLQRHMKCKHIGYECLKCHKKFRSNQSLQRHNLIHLDIKNFICDAEKCGKAFTTKGQLTKHKLLHSSEMFICEECGYKCRKRESLVVHKRHHTGEKPFACNLCNSRFGSKSLLCEHMASHETERKHVCDVCGKSFNRPKALYHHKHLHLGVKKFVCKICGQAYAQAAGLSAHTRKHREDVASFIANSSLNNVKIN